MPPVDGSIQHCLNPCELLRPQNMDVTREWHKSREQHGLDQEIFELQLLTVELDRAEVVSPQRTHLVVMCPPGHQQGRRKPIFQRDFLIKDLGIQARQLMGLPGYTQTWQTTRLVHQGEYMPMHLPLLALCPDSHLRKTVMEHCAFCELQLVNRKGGIGAFQYCWFCSDSPATHHGACCPHNPSALTWNGIPHRQQHERHIMKYLSTLPF